MKKKFLAMLLALTMALSLAACGGDSGTEEPSGSEGAGISAETVKIGLICVHDQNSGYDVAHIDGLTAACEELGIDPSTTLLKTRTAMTPPWIWRSRAATSSSPIPTVISPSCRMRPRIIPT